MLSPLTIVATPCMPYSNGTKASNAQSSTSMKNRLRRLGRVDVLFLLAVLIMGPATSATSEALSSSSSSANFSPRANTELNSAKPARNGIQESDISKINGFTANVNNNGKNGKQQQQKNGMVNGKSIQKNTNTNGIFDGSSLWDESQLIDNPVLAEYIADTKLPTDVGHFKLRAYRIHRVNGDRINANIGDEPVVIYSEDNPPFGKDGKLAQNVPIRVHDQCLTSEVFRSKRCDCKEQLKLALEYIKQNGGAIIYMQQEGRGIGLANKVAAYQLQDMGMDTVDANLHLGFPEDCRKYGAVPSILEDMKIGSIQLLTNNPRKVERLSELGVNIEGTIPILVPEANQYNRKYLETKHERMSHTNLAGILMTPTFIPSKMNGVKRNGNMRPRKVAVHPNPESLILPTGGGMEEIISKPPSSTSATKKGESDGVEVSLVVEGGADETSHDDVLDDVNGKSGVVAEADGYCFGRKSVEAAIAAVARGEMVVVVDDMDRENEGDLIMAADKCRDIDMANIIRYSSGVVCVAMEGKRMDELKLPSMVKNNEDPKGTAFSVTVDATKEHGITTGISAGDRAKTVRLLADPKSSAMDFNRPGHLFPLRARDGGVLSRDGHTEAAVDLSRLAGLNPCGILCEIVSEENPTEMMRLPELKRFAKRHGLVLTSIADLAQYIRDNNI